MVRRVKVEKQRLSLGLAVLAVETCEGRRQKGLSESVSSLFVSPVGDTSVLFLFLYHFTLLSSSLPPPFILLTNRKPQCSLWFNWSEAYDVKSRAGVHSADPVKVGGVVFSPLLILGSVLL